MGNAYGVYDKVFVCLTPRKYNQQFFTCRDSRSTSAMPQGCYRLGLWIESRPNDVHCSSSIQNSAEKQRGREQDNLNAVANLCTNQPLPSSSRQTDCRLKISMDFSSKLSWHHGVYRLARIVSDASC